MAQLGLGAKVKAIGEVCMTVPGARMLEARQVTRIDLAWASGHDGQGKLSLDPLWFLTRLFTRGPSEDDGVVNDATTLRGEQ